jgi:hypothetical protein
MSIALGHLDRAVSKDISNGIQRYAVHDQLARQDVTLVVNPEIFDPCLLDCRLERTPKRGQSLAVLSAKHPGTLRAVAGPEIGPG